jgi:riboflavin kinase
MEKATLPLWCMGSVVRGFGRGSKELGIPTANLDQDCIQKCISSERNMLMPGVYCGFARVIDWENCSKPLSLGYADMGIYPMVMSIGWNPFYQNPTKSAEVHILNTYRQDFYGAKLQLCISKYLRPEMNFPSKELLIQTIHDDIRLAKEYLKGERSFMDEFQTHFNTLQQ